ncbi:MAG: NADH-quinone oxidoreductase subunit C [Bacteroidetes bacterium]|nr:NADH-quinone oxidoreductase subunit C [Bacteroidota bacterium]
MALTNEQIQQKLTDKFGDVITEWNESYGMLAFRVATEQNLKVLQYLFDTEGFQFLTDLTAVHYPDRKGEELCVVYHLHNLLDNIRLRMKVYVPIEKPDVYTATKVFSGANWMERETYDNFGVNFVGHPNLTRILNVEEMDYFPLRKEYQMEDPTRTDKDDEMFGRGGSIM